MHGHERLARDILFPALLVCGSCSAAPTVTSKYENGHLSSTGGHLRQLRSGPWIDYYPNGNKQCEGSYEDDQQSGSWTYWFENGSKEMEGHFEKEQRNGEWRAWYENGALRAEGRFEGGFEEGMWRFHDRSGAIDHVGAFELGQPVLRWTYFHPDGTVRETGNYLAGVRVGIWTTQETAGNQTETLYPMPAGCELVEERFADSTLKRTGFLRDGSPVGRWISFHPGGKLRLECTFRNGAPDGSARAWREDGSLLACGRLKDGCIVGKWVFPRNDGQAEYETGEARPRQAFAGEWSPADSADLPGWTSVETWVAEMCSPRQPAPIPPAVAGQPTTPPPVLASDDACGIPAQPQHWTEFKRHVLPELVAFYTTGRPLGADDEVSGVSYPRRKYTTKPAGAVASPADLIGRTLPLKRFTTADGGAIDLDAFRGKQNVLVTILRGFGGQVCVYCTAQTRALAESAGKFAALDTQVVVVYPGPRSGLQAFLEAYRRTFSTREKPPFQLLYDTDLTLTRALNIEDNIAVPTSLLLDREGIIRWCHVGKDRTDRPSVQEILARIAELSNPER